MGTSSDPADHISPEFEQAFPAWRDFREFVGNIANSPAYNEDRALHQVLMADISSRFSPEQDWIQFGSLTLPARVSPDMIWPVEGADFGAPDLHPAYLLPRTAFDLDLYATPLAEGLERDAPERRYGELALDRVLSVAPRSEGMEVGVGLGGLVKYSAGELTLHDNGQLMGIVMAQPIDPRYGPRAAVPVDNPLAIEIDIKPSSKLRFKGDPEQPNRSGVAFDLPGFSPPMLPLFPTANQLADKLCLLAGPPNTMRKPPPVGPWHRYKDLFDVYFICSTCEIDGSTMQEAVQKNWNLARSGLDQLPRPYRLYGQQPVPKGVTPIPWDEECENLKKSNSQLGFYPNYSKMMKTVGAFVDSIDNSPDKGWKPRTGWAIKEVISHRNCSKPFYLNEPGILDSNPSFSKPKRKLVSVTAADLAQLARRAAERHLSNLTSGENGPILPRAIKAPPSNPSQQSIFATVGQAQNADVTTVAKTAIGRNWTVGDSARKTGPSY